jgi:hypothetical protein
MLRPGFPTRVAPPARGFSRARRGAALHSFAALAFASAPLAQTAAPPPGFAATVAFANTTHVAGLHRLEALADGRHLAAHGGALFESRDRFDPNDPTASRRLFAFAHEDIAFVAADAAGTDVFVAGLASGRIVRVDLATRIAVPHAPGVANAYDAVRLPAGDVLLAASPQWPWPGAHAGIWLAGPGRQPRELLALTGPSGPIVLAPSGDLIAAEIGHAGPSTARLLRVPAARLQQALAGATLTLQDVTAVGGGWANVHDLACAPDGRLFVSDAATGILLATAPGSLAPGVPWLDVGPGRAATTLRLVGSGTAAPAPFVAFAPPQHAPELAVVASDFTSSLEVLRVAPRRPSGAIAPSAQLAPGTSTLHVTAGPALGLVLWLASAQSPAPEQIALTLHGTPLWLGLELASATSFALAPLDAAGAASTPIVNPGGVAAAFSFQAVVLGAPAGQLGSTAPLALQFLP